jgi:predicted small lipoprotein YifL
MKNVLKMTALVLCCVALVACSQKGPAEAALTAATTAVDGVKAEAAKYVPDQAKSLMASLTSAREAFDKGDYKMALESATAIPAKAKEAAAAVAAKKDELTKSFTALTGSLPATVEQIKAKVGEYVAMGKKLPKDMDPAKLDAAKSGLEAAQKTWAEANEAFKSGDLMGAVAKGNDVKGKADQLLAALNIATKK